MFTQGAHSCLCDIVLYDYRPRFADVTPHAIIASPHITTRSISNDANRYVGSDQSTCSVAAAAPSLE